MTETRKTSSTGGEKGQKDEAYALIPVGPLAEVARVYGFGAEKYSDHNWRKGYPYSWSYSALQRHINAFWSGEDTDPESGRSHLAHAAFHLFSLMEFVNEELGEDDRYRKAKEVKKLRKRDWTIMERAESKYGRHPLFFHGPFYEAVDYALNNFIRPGGFEAAELKSGEDRFEVDVNGVARRIL